jgi:regulator of PEP synthase PpsR (kinase-PPPase family)
MNLEGKRKINVHLVSDSTAETVQRIAQSVISQFPDCYPVFFLWPIINKKTRVLTVIRALKKHPGIVLYTIADNALVNILSSELKDRDDIILVPGLDYITMQFARFLQVVPQNISLLHQIDENYFKKIDIMNFTHEHDDGRSTKNIHEADIILLGVSRTSKTPTSIYLSHRGFKVANIPIFNFSEYQDVNDWIVSHVPKGPLVIGLTINPSRLYDIRKNRMKEKDAIYDNKYVDFSEIDNEIRLASKLFGKLHCPVIDVTNRSIEETSAHIIRIYHIRMMNAIKN